MIQIIDQSTAHTHDGKTRLTFTIEIPAREQIGAPLDLERGLPKALSEVEGQQALNGLGQEVMTEALSRYDTEGEQIRFGSYSMTSKGRSPESYKTLFGEVALERHTYQSSDGGKTFCPLEHNARICENASIGLCQILASKHVSLSGRCLPFRQAPVRQAQGLSEVERQGLAETEPAECPERSRRAAGAGVIPPAGL